MIFSPSQPTTASGSQQEYIALLQPHSLGGLFDRRSKALPAAYGVVMGVRAPRVSAVGGRLEGVREAWQTTSNVFLGIASWEHSERRTV